MSDFKQREKQLNNEKDNLLNKKIRLKSEINQIQNDKIQYKQKTDILSFNEAVKKEKCLDNELKLLESDLIAVETKIKTLKLEEKQEKDKLERKRKEDEKRRQTKKLMDDVLRYLRMGKNRNDAAKLVGIKESKILHWCREGKLGTNDNTTYFYNEITKIEKDQQKRQKVNKAIEQNAINDMMYDVLEQMEMGKTRKQAAQILAIKYSRVNEWYEKGLNHENNDFYQFYKRINEIESSHNDSQNTLDLGVNNPKINVDEDRQYSLPEVVNQNSASIVEVRYCQNCGTKISDYGSKYCTSCGNSLIEVKDEYEKSSFNFKSKSTVATKFGKCCAGLMVIFVIIAILMVIV